jgi:hypothetical protein
MPRIHPIATRRKPRSMSPRVNMVSFLLCFPVCDWLTTTGNRNYL